ncbi:MAG: hypothetical protein M3Y26_09470 [Actinomycetota bacterium]|nr:hypothetical protein [Actinomycetota bacterium]
MRLFSLALAIDLLVVQFFHLLDDAFLGFTGVFIALLLYALSRAMLYRAEHPHEVSPGKDVAQSQPETVQ